MKKKFFYGVVALAITMISVTALHSQSSSKTIVFKQGEVLDILLLSQNSEVDADLKSYFQTAFPVAKRMSYQPLPGFKIKDHTQGNHRPSSLILGKWSDLKNREAFLTEIINEVPDFHERRRKIWSYFGLCYFEMQEDLSFEIDRKKYHVATAYWLKEKEASNTFFKKWKKSLGKKEGNILVELKNGTSPFGYQYQPDYFVISSWENEAAFKTFQEKIQRLNRDHIQHVNEFILE